MNESGSWEGGSLVARSVVSRDQAATAFLGWLAAHKYTPVDLLQPSLLYGARQVYLPYFSFRVGYNADYSVSIGYHSMEEYTAYETVYENGRSRQVPRTKSRLRTDWHPYKNRITGSFVEVVPDQTLRGGDFSAFLHETTFRTEELVPPSSIGDDGQVLAFARTPQESYARFVEDTMSERVSSKIKKSLPGDQTRSRTAQRGAAAEPDTNGAEYQASSTTAQRVGGARTLRNRAAEIREGTLILWATPRSRKGPSSQAASF